MIVYEVRDVAGYAAGSRERPFKFHDMKKDAERDQRSTKTAELVTWNIQGREDLTRLGNTIGAFFETHAELGS